MICKNETVNFAYDNRNGARRIAANIAKLPELTSWPTRCLLNVAYRWANKKEEHPDYGS